MFKLFATASVLLGYIFMASAAPAAQQDECNAQRLIRKMRVKPITTYA